MAASPLILLLPHSLPLERVGLVGSTGRLATFRLVPGWADGGSSSIPVSSIAMYESGGVGPTTSTVTRVDRDWRPLPCPRVVLVLVLVVAAH